MNRFMYGSNGRPMRNSELDITALLDEKVPEGGQPMDIGDSTVGSRAEQLDKIYMTLAGAIMSSIRAEALQKRRLASGLIVYTVERHVQLESGIEAVQPRDVNVAYNFEDFFQPPADIVPEPRGYEHTHWIAQELINYDFGVQTQQRKIASRNY